jgi:isopentenyl-diphosphate delta-isomerase
VDSWEWCSWESFLAEARADGGDLSPWARLQAPLLDERHDTWRRALG